MKGNKIMIMTTKMKLSDNGNGELKHGKTTKSKRGKVIAVL